MTISFIDQILLHFGRNTQTNRHNTKNMIFSVPRKKRKPTKTWIDLLPIIKYDIQHTNKQTNS